MTRLKQSTWLNTIWDGSDRKEFHGKERRCVAMPLGGIGTGHLCICGDGSLRQWQMLNTLSHVAYVPNSFFALRFSQSGSQPVSCVLQTQEFWDDDEFEHAPNVTDAIVPLQMKSQLVGLPMAKSTIMKAEYPIAEIKYELQDIPVLCVLSAWSPFYLFDSEKSGIPCAVFEFEITNISDQICSVSLMGTLQNFIGWDGFSSILGNDFDGFCGNWNRQTDVNDWKVVEMFNTKLTQDDGRNGELGLACKGGDISVKSQWSFIDDLFNEFTGKGWLSESNHNKPSEVGFTWNGAICSKHNLKPKETEKAVFIFMWRFPNRYQDFMKHFEVPDNPKNRFYLGNEYCSRYKNILEVAQHITKDFDKIKKQTYAYREHFYESNLPYFLLDAISANSSTLRTNVCIRTDDKRFFGFEGACGASAGGVYAAGGCCPLNCTHVWNYDQTLFTLFPGLHKDMRDTDWQINQHTSGYLPHRTTMPLYLKRYWDVPIGGPTNPAIDGLFAGILKTYQQWKTYQDEDWSSQTLPKVQSAIEYVLNVCDEKGDGVLYGEQPNTYDISLFGPNTFIGSQYLSALVACEKMFEELNNELSKKCRERFEQGRINYEKLCWNGEYYVQVIEKDKHDYQYGEGCMSDMLLGQWWAHVCDLGYLFPKEKIESCLNAIYKRNFRDDFSDFKQIPRVFVSENDRGLLNCTYEPWQRPKVPLLYSDEVWSGIEYCVASLMMYEGMYEQGLQIAKAVRDRYSGFNRNPFNEIECGDHYVRPMSAMSLLFAIIGTQYEAKTKTLKFRITWPKEELKAPFFSGKTFGTINIKNEKGKLKGKLKIHQGDLLIERLLIELTYNALSQPNQAIKLRQVSENQYSFKPEHTVIKQGETLEF